MKGLLRPLPGEDVLDYAIRFMLVLAGLCVVTMLAASIVALLALLILGGLGVA